VLPAILGGVLADGLSAVWIVSGRPYTRVRRFFAETDLAIVAGFLTHRAWIGAVVLAVGACTAETEPKLAPVSTDPDLSFSVDEGRNDNIFYRNGPVAAHLVATSGRQPRLIVAFPAGNSGVSLWFDEHQHEVVWSTIDDVRGVSMAAQNGDVLYGIETELLVGGAPVRLRRGVLGNVRSIRGYAYTDEMPVEIDVAPTVRNNRVVWQRTRLDGEGGYYLSVEALEGTIARTGSAHFELVPDGNDRLRLRLTALTGDEPLTPIPADRVVTDQATDDELSRQVLAFLSYEQKLLAGSWRYLTYFGRDTLLSLKMLMPVATPELIEAGLGAVIDRVSPGGEVAHEEDIAEYALLRRAGDVAAPEPIFDYKMIDDNLILAPVVAEYLIDDAQGRQRASSFLQRKTPLGDTYGKVLVRNLRFVVEQTRDFTERPGTDTLIRLKAGKAVGNWRDSRDGLGGGVIPYDVNAVFAPAALRATARLLEAGILDAFVGGGDSPLAAAAAMATVWEQRAPPFFHVRLDNETARRQIHAYAQYAGVDAEAALAALGDDDVRLHAVGLHADGTPVPVVHTDDGFALAFSDPDSVTLRSSIETMVRPFPAGLTTPVGLLTANGAYGDRATTWPTFSQNRYHGAVVWSWQQAMLAHGLERQLAREDIDDELRAYLAGAQARLWRAIQAGSGTKTSELWSWSFDNGEYRIEPFGQRAADVTESNAAQLWSTVYLAVQPPNADPQPSGGM